MIPEPRNEPNPWRRQVEALAHIQEAMRLLGGGGWRETVRLLDRASDSVEYSIDAAGYNSWEYAHPMAGRHERPTRASSWPPRHHPAYRHLRQVWRAGKGKEDTSPAKGDY